MDRRHFLALAVHAVAAASAGCAESVHGQERGKPLLAARPRSTADGAAPGRHPLGLATPRDGEWFVPAAARGDSASPLVLMLHGAGSRAAGLRRIHAAAEQAGVIVVAPDSRGSTWDAIRGRFGPDVAFIDRALEHVFARCRCDPRRLAIGGFSDGASYALSLGLANGDLFSHVLAFSPGFVVSVPRRGQPRIFVSHGTDDTILPIDVTSRAIVPRLRRDGYVLRYEEFDGPHTVPAEIQRQAFSWLVE